MQSSTGNKGTDKSSSPSISESGVFNSKIMTESVSEENASFIGAKSDSDVSDELDDRKTGNVAVQISKQMSCPDKSSEQESNTTKLQRSTSLDVNFLQRPPSHITIRNTIKAGDGPSTGSGTSSLAENEEPDNSLLLSKSGELSRNTTMAETVSEENSSFIGTKIDSGVSDLSGNYETGGSLQSSPIPLSQINRSNEENINFECIECVKPIPVLSQNDIQKGDHLLFAGAVYDHHAIVISAECDKNDENKVTLCLVEATNTVFGAAVGMLKIFGGKADLVRSEKVVDIQKQKLMIVLYRYPLYSKQDIVDRALDTTKQRSNRTSDERYKYNLIKNNCEHFATWCVTGKKFSVQARKFTVIAATFVKRGFKGISDERKRNELLCSKKLLCEPCFKLNKKLLSAPRREVKSKSDVQAGDIITYSYWNLWHDAIVTEVPDTENTTKLECKIVHYAFCGITSHREIKEENFSLLLDGRVRVTDYPESDYNVYSRAEVIRRARYRIGEQLFAFFANDSSHFARWCKLKVEGNTY